MPTLTHLCLTHAVEALREQGTLPTAARKPLWQRLLLGSLVAGSESVSSVVTDFANGGSQQFEGMDQA